MKHFGRLMCWVSALFVVQSMPAAAEMIRTKAPQEHVDGFMSRCKIANVPTASCTCIIKKLSETREGDAVVDAVGMMEARKSEAERKASVVPLLNRHGMRVSELKAILDPGNPLLQNITRQCN